MADYSLFPSILPNGEDAVAEVAGDVNLEDAEAALDAGDCPFCDAYDGDHPANHAPKAHPNRWTALKEARDRAGDADPDPSATESAQTSAESVVTDGGEN